ncbi:MAG: hypothetical protein KH420_07665, partial [Clostridiales bacterium]|nr:hypothetical protein [Clostridiales bacterium]
MIQLYLEYAPAPPFEGGTPELAPPHIYARVQAQLAERLQRRVMEQAEWKLLPRAVQQVCREIRKTRRDAVE